jgi:hypothetical protein
MYAIAYRSWILVLLLAPLALADEAKLNVRQGIPADAFLAVYGQRNPERDFQRDFAQAIWQTIADEKLPERVVALMMERLPGEQKETIDSITAELRTIFEPVDWSAVADSPEAAYGQVMEVPQTNHLLVLRMPSAEVAISCETALHKLGEMVERRSEGAIDATVADSDSVPVQTLSAAKIKDFPFQPSFARIDDVLVISTSAQLVHQSVESLLSGGESKFDDPRLTAALEKLPKPEDALVFYDGQQQFRKMRDIGKFIRDKAANDAKAVRVAGLVEKVVDQLAILDYEVTVEYTDGQRNVKEALGQLVPGAEDKLLYRVCAQGEPFENWQRWVPADAQAYKLSTGANLHVLYEGVVKFLHDEVPEAQPALDKFDEAQNKWGVHLDRDILQSFSGECVSVKLPAASPSMFGAQDQVLALRCQHPEQIRKLIARLVERLAKIPWAQSQQLQMVPSEKLSGFDELSLTMLSAAGVRPVIGFHEGWMIVATNASAAERVLQTLSGAAPSIDSTEHFRRFGLAIEGPVYAVSYSDLAASTRQAAQFIRQAGMFAPMAVAAAGAKAKPEQLKPLTDALALLPSVANVVEKFDYLEARLSVIQKGDAPGSYVKRNVTLVRPPKAGAAEKPAAKTARLESTRRQRGAPAGGR